MDKVTDSIKEQLSSNGQDKGLRLNAGKPRYDLFEPFAMEQLAGIFMKGAKKYTIEYINKWEKLMHASHATKMELSIANQNVVAVTKNNYLEIILNTQKNNESTQNSGIKSTRTERENWIELGDLIQLKEKEIKEQNGLVCSENLDSQNNHIVSCVKKVVKYVDQKIICTLTMTIPQGNSEVSYVVNATTVSDSWETMWKVLKEQLHISKELENLKNSGERNWEQGMKWSKCEASLRRHLEAYVSGKDYDFDPNCEGCKSGNCTNHTGQLHIAQVAWNALAITSYYKIYPQGDDRQHKYLKRPKIGLDIDEVICDWAGAWTKKFGYPVPGNWNFSYKNKDHFESFTPEELNTFYLSIPPKIKPSDIPFEPHCYITSRSVPVELTKQWIQQHGFPTVPVYSVGFEQSKVEVAKQSGINLFVDDRYENFVELNNAGICTFLLDAPHNQRYDVGYKRIKKLNELV